MKALYLLWPDMDYVTRAVDAGIDTLLVALYDPRPDIPPNPYWGSYPEIVAALREIRVAIPRDKAQVLLVPTWYSAWWTHLPEADQFVWQGKRRAKTPCPCSSYHPSWALSYPLEIYKAGLCDGIVLDMENYGADQDPDRLPYYTNSDTPLNGLRCECPRCKDLSEENQRGINADLINAAFRTAMIPISGIMPYSSSYVWRGLLGDRWWFNEDTYLKYSRGRVSNPMKANRGETVQQCCGAWAEHFMAQDLLDHLKKVGASIWSEGYWIYPQTRFSKHSRLTEYETNLPPHMGLIDAEMPDFFSRLEALNLYIERKRKSLLFRVRRWFFRL